MSYEPFASQEDAPARPRRRGRPRKADNAWLYDLRPQLRRREGPSINNEILEDRRQEFAARRRAVLDVHRSDRRSETRESRRARISRVMSSAPNAANLSAASIAAWLKRTYPDFVESDRTLRGDIAALRKAGSVSQ